MPSELLSLAEASGVLGLSVERVRQLVVSGQLPGRRFGNVWVVPLDAIAARRHSPGVRGRPLSPMRAWEEIVAGRVELPKAGRYHRRAELVRCDVSRADAGALPARVGALIGGVAAAAEHGELLAADEHADVYLSRSAFASLDSLVAFIPDPLGSVALRVVDDEAWALIPAGGVAPRGAVALDLLESGDPRHWIAAEHLLGQRG